MSQLTFVPSCRCNDLWIRGRERGCSRREWRWGTCPWIGWSSWSPGAWSSLGLLRGGLLQGDGEIPENLSFFFFKFIEQLKLRKKCWAIMHDYRHCCLWIVQIAAKNQTIFRNKMRIPYLLCKTLPSQIVASIALVCLSEKWVERLVRSISRRRVVWHCIRSHVAHLHEGVLNFFLFFRFETILD